MRMVYYSQCNEQFWMDKLMNIEETLAMMGLVGLIGLMTWVQIYDN